MNISVTKYECALYEYIEYVIEKTSNVLHGWMSIPTVTPCWDKNQILPLFMAPPYREWTLFPERKIWKIFEWKKWTGCDSTQCLQRIFCNPDILRWFAFYYPKWNLTLIRQVKIFRYGHMNHFKLDGRWCWIKWIKLTCESLLVEHFCRRSQR